MSIYSYGRSRTLLNDYTYNVGYIAQTKLRTLRIHISIHSLIVGILGVIGIIGNSLAFAVFQMGQFNKSTSFLFMCLSLTDSAMLLTAFVCWTIAAFVHYTDYIRCFLELYRICALGCFTVVWWIGEVEESFIHIVAPVPFAE